MEKLIELLYKYQKIECFYPLYYDVEENKIYFDSDGRAEIGAEQYLISKDFGFIKRLVDNNKINLEELQYFGNDEMQEDFSTEDLLLMLLSISSSPIDDLLSYLK